MKTSRKHPTDEPANVRPAPPTFANRFAQRLITDAALSPAAWQLVHHGALSQESLPQVLAWCCDHGESGLLDEVLTAAREQSLVIAGVSIAADCDEDTAAAIVVLSRHPSVSAVELFRVDGGDVRESVVGPRTAQALKDALLGTDGNAPHIGHLAIRARVADADLDAVIDTLGAALKRAPVLTSFSFDVRNAQTDQLVRVCACVAFNKHIVRVGLTLPSQDAEASDGYKMGAMLACSAVIELRLECDDPWFHAACMSQLSELGGLMEVKILSIGTLDGRRLAPVSSTLYRTAIVLLQQTCLLGLEVSGFAVKSEAHHETLDPEGSVDSMESLADSKEESITEMPSQILFFRWPDSGMPASTQTTIEDAVARNTIEASTWRVDKEVARHVGFAFGRSAHASVGGTAGELLSTHLWNTRDLVALESVNRSTHVAGVEARSQAFAQRLLALIDGDCPAELRPLALKMKVTGVGLLPRHLALVHSRAKEKGLEHLTRGLPMA